LAETRYLVKNPPFPSLLYESFLVPLTSHNPLQKNKIQFSGKYSRSNFQKNFWNYMQNESTNIPSNRTTSTEIGYPQKLYKNHDQVKERKQRKYKCIHNKDEEFLDRNELNYLTDYKSMEEIQWEDQKKERLRQKFFEQTL